MGLLILILGLWSALFLLDWFFPQVEVWYPWAVVWFVDLPDPYIGEVVQVGLAFFLLLISALVLAGTVQYKRELELDLADMDLGKKESSGEEKHTKEGMAIWVIAITLSALGIYFVNTHFEYTPPAWWKEVRAWFLETDGRPLSIPVIAVPTLYVLGLLITAITSRPRFETMTKVLVWLYLVSWLVVYLAS